MKKKRLSVRVEEWALVMLGLLSIAYVLFLGWGAMNSSEATLLPSLNLEKATPPPVAELKLNKDHQRRGATVEVDPGRIGRENPFAAP